MTTAAAPGAPTVAQEPGGWLAAAAQAIGGLGQQIASFFRATLAPAVPTGRQRGLALQLARRRAEQGLRDFVLEQVQPLEDAGVPRVVRARALGIPDSTLYDWEQRRGARPQPRGRPALRGTREQRDAVLRFLRATGPQVGVPTLGRSFPSLPRRELEAMKRRFRALTLQDGYLLAQELEWTRAGAAWAMDFSQLDVPIDGCFSHALVVRDLASGYLLMVLPARAQDAELVVVPALAQLFRAHGPPLVLKKDNGSPLNAGCVQDLLETHQILDLRSPPYTPRYNGACEAGIGQLQTHAFYLAATQGGWTGDVLEAARHQTNSIVRPSGQTAEATWQARQPLPDTLRAELRATYDRLAAEEWKERGQSAILPAGALPDFDRLLIPRALVEHELLRVRGRRIPLPIKSRFRPVLS